MDKILNLADEITISIKNSELYQNYLNSKDKINKDSELKKRIKDFREKSMSFQSKLMQNQEVSFEEEKYISSLYFGLIVNEDVKTYFKNEELLLNLMANIYNKLGNECRLDLDF